MAEAVKCPLGKKECNCGVYQKEGLCDYPYPIFATPSLIKVLTRKRMAGNAVQKCS